MTHATARITAYSKPETRKFIKERSAIKCRETAIHKAIIQACKLLLRDDVMVFHVANERRCSEKEGAFLKSLGVVAGVPDLIFILPGGFTCWMEIKVPGGSLSAAQEAFHNVLATNEHRCVVVHSVKEALDVLELWNCLKRGARAA